VKDASYYLARSGGRLACPHPPHRFAQVPNSPAEIILPECAGRERWLTARREGVGGSEVGALLGVSEYETVFSVWKTKMEGGKDLSGVPAVEWGHRLENVVAEKTAEEIGLVSRFAGGLWADRERPVLRVTPDRFATRPRSWKAIGVIECKTAGDGEDWESGSITPGGQGNGRAPLSYQVQIQWQMGILGLKKGWLGCFVSNQQRDFYTVEVDFDRKWFAEMTAEAERFYVVNVLGNEMPMHDLRHPKTEEMLKQLHPTVEKASVDLPEGSEDFLKSWGKLKAAVEKADADLDQAKNFFRMWTADAGAAYWTDKDGRAYKVVSYPVVNTTNLNVTKLREKYPEIAKEMTEQSSHRRLTVTVPKPLKS
jgi:putative phage-type endonuclease